MEQSVVGAVAKQQDRHRATQLLLAITRQDVRTSYVYPTSDLFKEETENSDVREI